MGLTRWSRGTPALLSLAICASLVRASRAVVNWGKPGCIRKKADSYIYYYYYYHYYFRWNLSFRGFFCHFWFSQETTKERDSLSASLSATLCLICCCFSYLCCCNMPFSHEKRTYCWSFILFNWCVQFRQFESGWCKVISEYFSCTH